VSTILFEICNKVFLYCYILIVYNSAYCVILNDNFFCRQILPRSLLNNSIPAIDEAYEAILSNINEQPVFLYMHGNSGNRASSHRLELYKLFQDLNYHVIMF